MPRLVRHLLVALAILSAGVVATPAHAQKKSDNVVKVKATADKPDANGAQTVTVTLDIEKPWHTYANPVGNKDLVGTETVVKFAAKQPVTVVKATYPKGIEEPDNVVGNYFIYEGKLTITAEIKRTPGDTSPLEVSVFVQACTSPKDGGVGSCLLPATIKTTVP